MMELEPMAGHLCKCGRAVFPFSTNGRQMPEWICAGCEGPAWACRCGPEAPIEVATVKIRTYQCQRCGRRFSTMLKDAPKRCGKCKSPYWARLRGQNRTTRPSRESLQDA